MNLSQKERQLLGRFRLFSGLRDDELERALTLLQAERAAYKADAVLKSPGAAFTRFGLVMTGLINVYSDDIDGNPALMATVTPGKSFGESLCILGLEENVTVTAAADSELLWLCPPREPMHDLFRQELCERFTALLAERTLSMNRRIQILSKLTLRSKLLTFFSDYGAADGRPFLVPFSRQDMAIYLGCDRSALSRELSRMKEEGLIDYRGNCFAVYDSGHFEHRPQ